MTKKTKTSSAQDAMRTLGSEQISDAELISIALGKSVSHAHELLSATDGFEGLVRKNVLEFQDIPKIGKATASKLVALVELARRISRVQARWTTSLRSPPDVARFIRATIGHLEQENFLLIGLDSRQRVILTRTIAVGSVSQVDVHPRELFRPCIRHGVHSIIIAHNHPSGDAEPSKADVDLTHRMCEVGRLVGIPVLDHLVVTAADHVSLTALGLVPAT